MMDRDADARQSRFLGAPQHKVDLQHTALLVIDMQYLDAHLDYGLCQQAREAGEDLTYYVGRLETAIANISRLLAGFRSRRMEVIYSRIQSLTPDGRDRSRAHKTAGIHAPPESQESMILEGITPAPGEIVFSKTVSSVFVGTNIDYVLRNMGIECLVMTGVLTSGCVEAAVRDAFDRNYKVILVEDACADFVEQFHQTAVDVLRLAAMVTTTDTLLETLPSDQRII